MSNDINERKIFLLKHFLVLFLSVFLNSCNSNKEKTENFKDYTSITFRHKEHDFGIIPAGKSVNTLFQFSNTGKNPLLIKEVTTSCGCTVPKWSKVMIEPNGNGEIKIVYDAKYPGRFNKTITVIYNGKDSPLELTIKGEVIYPETNQEAKLNNTIKN